VGVLI